MAAEALEADVADVEVHVGDTALGPDSGSCTASRSVYTGGNAIFRAATAMRELMRREAPRILGCDADTAAAATLGQIAVRAAEQGIGLETDGAFIWPESKVTIPGAFGLPHIINT